MGDWLEWLRRENARLQAIKILAEAKVEEERLKNEKLQREIERLRQEERERNERLQRDIDHFQHENDRLRGERNRALDAQEEYRRRRQRRRRAHNS
jgi:hypothetical protein